jgi:AAA domain/Winged helix-turn-helix DNA-binding
MIPEGLTLVVGRPKLGKSWFALDICLGVAGNGFVMGGIKPACSGDVLDLALEDNQRRLQKRCTKLRGALKTTWPERLTLATRWGRLDKGGLQGIIAWIKGANEPRLIVIDTLPKVRPLKANTGYAEDYDALAELQKLAGERGIAILVLHHTRKQEAEDPLDTGSGTLGLAGSADTILVLNRTAQGVTLYSRGRDIETFERAMQFDPDTCQLRMLGDAAEVQRSETRTTILRALQGSDEPMTPREIADGSGLSSNVVKQRLRDMVVSGEVVKTPAKIRRGGYAHPSSVTG